MPTYEYACTSCGHRLEAVQSFSDDPLTDAPSAAGALRKVYGAVGIVLKGSGFYKTDSRAAAAAANGSGEEGRRTSRGDTASSDSSEKLRRRRPRRQTSAARRRTASDERRQRQEPAEPAELSGTAS